MIGKIGNSRKIKQYMSGIIIDQEQSKKFKLDRSFWVDLYHFENDDCGCEYSYEIACQLKQLEEKGFVNPWNYLHLRQEENTSCPQNEGNEKLE